MAPILARALRGGRGVRPPVRRCVRRGARGTPVAFLAWSFFGRVDFRPGGGYNKGADESPRLVTRFRGRLTYGRRSRTRLLGAAGAAAPTCFPGASCRSPPPAPSACALSSLSDAGTRPWRPRRPRSGHRRPQTRRRGVPYPWRRSNLSSAARVRTYRRHGRFYQPCAHVHACAAGGRGCGTKKPARSGGRPGGRVLSWWASGPAGIAVPGLRAPRGHDSRRRLATELPTFWEAGML